MSKTYILQKDIDHPMWKIPKGIKMVSHGKTKDSAYVYNDWFVLHPDYVENRPEWFLPEENKSNDSFQEKKWSDQDMKDCYQHALTHGTHGASFESYFNWLTNVYKPKPQAENKPDWEIVAYEFLPLSESIRPFWIDKNSVHWERAKTDSEFRVFSVKRLSDGEVFSVGEETNWGKIKMFTFINDGKDLIAVLDWGKEENKMQRYIKDLRKLKPQPQKEEQKVKVIQTEDGVAMSGQKGFVLDTNNWNFAPCTLPCSPFPGAYNEFKYFHSKDAAEFYIKSNKPFSISMKELGSCITNIIRSGVRFPHDIQETTVIDWKKLDELIKSKQ